MVRNKGSHGAPETVGAACPLASGMHGDPAGGSEEGLHWELRRPGEQREGREVLETGRCRGNIAEKRVEMGRTMVRIDSRLKI